MEDQILLSPLTLLPKLISHQQNCNILFKVLQSQSFLVSDRFWRENYDM